MKTALICLAVLLAAPALGHAFEHATYRPGSVWAEDGDLPGCTFPIVGSAWAPGREECRQGCCALHDECFADNGCTEASWTTTAQDLGHDFEEFLGIAPAYSWTVGRDVEWLVEAFAGTPSGADATPECSQCNIDAVACFGSAIRGLSCANPAGCPEGQQSCYDRSCEAGKNFYCSTDCYNAGTDPCDYPWGDDRCATAISMGYGAGTRLSMHGGAFSACVPWCYNLAVAKGTLDGGGLDGYGESSTSAQAVGIPTSMANGALCCFCGDGGFPWEDPAWPFEPDEYYERHDGAEGGHTGDGACTSAAYAIVVDGNTVCWNNGHMCSQDMGDVCNAVGMCCG